MADAEGGSVGRGNINAEGSGGALSTRMMANGEGIVVESPARSESGGSVQGGGEGARTYKEMVKVLQEMDKESDELAERIVGLHLQFADLLVKSATLIDPDLVKIVHECDNHLKDFKGDSQKDKGDVVVHMQIGDDGPVVDSTTNNTIHQ